MRCLCGLVVILVAKDDLDAVDLCPTLRIVLYHSIHTHLSPMPTIFAGVLLILFSLVHVRAHHAVCSYRPFTRPPFYQHFYLWCVADRHDIGHDQAEYHCNDKRKNDLLIADYGKLRPGILEWGQSCRTEARSLR